MYNGRKDPEHEQRLERAWRFYSKVMNHRRRQGKGCAKAHNAAIGLPKAIQGRRGREHVRAFIDMALADGTPLDDLILLAEELAREMGRQKRF